MKTYLKIFIVSIFLCSVSFSFGQNVDTDFDNHTIEVIVNGEKVSVQDLPQNGFVEVFNILGSKVMSFQVNSGKSTARINLPKGYYILKSDEVTRKIVVK